MEKHEAQDLLDRLDGMANDELDRAVARCKGIPEIVADHEDWDDDLPDGPALVVFHYDDGDYCEIYEDGLNVVTGARWHPSTDPEAALSLLGEMPNPRVSLWTRPDERPRGWDVEAGHDSYAWANRDESLTVAICRCWLRWRLAEVVRA